MKVIICLLLPATLWLAAAQGSFRGKIVRGPERESDKTWLYVQNPKGSIRRVDISSARVSYARQVGKRNRLRNPSDSLSEGVQVQVSASQDEDGEWRATTVTILAISDNERTTKGYAAVR